MSDTETGYESGAPEPAPALPANEQSTILPSQALERERQSQMLILLIARLLFMVMLVTVTLLPFVGQVTDQRDIPFTAYVPVLIGTFVFGVVVLIVDASVPNKRLAPVFGVYLGIVAGLVGAIAIGALIDFIADSWDLRNSIWLPYLNVIKLTIGVTLCYLAVSIVLTTKDDVRLVIPYVEFAKQVRGIRPLVIDTSILIDGRIDALGRTGFVDAPLIVPQFVIDELQTLADSADKLKRARGRRGLSIMAELQSNPYIDISIDATEGAGRSVDHMLLSMAREQNLRILTTDYNLNKVAEIQGVTVLNVNDIASTMRTQAIAGETLQVEVVKRGEGQGQGVGYMPDGTMVVVEEAAERVGDTVRLIVTNSLQTTAGRMIFGRIEGADDDPSAPERIGQAATSQPRQTTTPPKQRPKDSRRNPRR